MRRRPRVFRKDAPVRVADSIDRKIHELRKQLGKTKKETNDHWSNLQQAWRAHEAEILNS